MDAHASDLSTVAFGCACEVNLNPVWKRKILGAAFPVGSRLRSDRSPDDASAAYLPPRKCDCGVREGSDVSHE